MVINNSKGWTNIILHLHKLSKFEYLCKTNISLNIYQKYFISVWPLWKITGIFENLFHKPWAISNQNLTTVILFYSYQSPLSVKHLLSPGIASILQAVTCFTTEVTDRTMTAPHGLEKHQLYKHTHAFFHSSNKAFSSLHSLGPFASTGISQQLSASFF